MKKIFAIFALTAGLWAQNWSGVLAPARAIDWSTAGAGVIPNWSTPCASQPTLQTGSSNAAANHTALINAWNADVGGSGCVINIPTGTYYFTNTTLTRAGNANVVIKAASPNTTSFIFTNTGSNQILQFTNGDGSYFGAPANVATWTAGYAKGTTVLTFGAVTTGSITGLVAGRTIQLDQLDDSGSPGNDIYACDTLGVGASTNCAIYDTSGFNRSGRLQFQSVSVVSCIGANAAACSSGTATAPYTVTVTPGLYHPQWSGSKSPGAWWSSSQPLTSAGIENITLDYSQAGTTGAGLWLKNVHDFWYKNIRSINSTSASTAIHKHIWTETSNHITVRDSYFYGSNPQREGYAIDFSYESGDNLAENNICQHLASCILPETDVGSVYAYNYDVDIYYNIDPQWQTADVDFHHAGDSFILVEGHEGTEWQPDSMLGTNWMNTVFRSYLQGQDPTLSGGQAKAHATFAIMPMAFSRYNNVIGNVLGKASYFTHYQNNAPDTTSCGNAQTSWLSVYAMGWSDQGGNRYANACGSGAGTAADINDDPLVASTIMRWGNYAACTGDAACNAVRFQTSENGSAAVTYPALSSPSQTLPPSFYLSAKPAWWGATIPWPPIGPDVTSGNIPNVGGFANHTPAGNCYLNIMGGLTDGSSGPLSFDANTCYAISTAPAVQLSPTSLNFGNQPVGTTSPSQTVTLTNIGNAQLTINSITGTGDFGMSQTCGVPPVVVAISASCQFTVTFIPTVSGARSGSITISDDASDSPQVIPLTGNGTSGIAKIQGNIVIQGNVTIK